jgi:hypothetical protein
MKNLLKVAVALLPVVALGACVAVSSPVGSSQGAVPPQLVKGVNGIVWDNPSAFGPVPASVSATGANVCANLNTDQTKYVAIGYHAMAKDLNGDSLPGGGYFCAAK